jgi:hypothetical protein
LGDVLGLNNKNIVIFSQILTDMAQKYDQLWSAYVMQMEITKTGKLKIF